MSAARDFERWVALGAEAERHDVELPRPKRIGPRDSQVRVAVRVVSGGGSHWAKIGAAAEAATHLSVPELSPSSDEPVGSVRRLRNPILKSCRVAGAELLDSCAKETNTANATIASAFNVDEGYARDWRVVEREFGVGHYLHLVRRDPQMSLTLFCALTLRALAAMGPDRRRIALTYLASLLQEEP